MLRDDDPGHSEIEWAPWLRTPVGLRAGARREPVYFLRSEIRRRVVLMTLACSLSVSTCS
jgi:hypothetical protein